MHLVFTGSCMVQFKGCFYRHRKWLLLHKRLRLCLPLQPQWWLMFHQFQRRGLFLQCWSNDMQGTTCSYCISGGLMKVPPCFRVLNNWVTLRACSCFTHSICILVIRALGALRRSGIAVRLMYLLRRGLLGERDVAFS